jgi:Mrp family chromosome partitioning ATPase
VGNVLAAIRKHQAEQAAAGATPTENLNFSSPETVIAPPAPIPTVPVAAKFPQALLVGYRDSLGRLAEQFRCVATKLVSASADGKISLAVASSCAGEGRTLACLHLGLALSENPDRRVVLVDAHPQAARLSAMLGCSRRSGLADVLAGKCSPASALVRCENVRLDVFPAGSSAGTDNSSVLKNSFDAAVDFLRQRYDCVLVDMPSVDSGEASLRVARGAGNAILIVRAGETKNAVVHKAVDSLKNCRVKLLGLVLVEAK